MFDRHTLPGVGGQIDFLRGAALCVDGLGKPILALNSVTKKGETKIVPFMKQGEIIGESSEYISILGYFKTPGPRMKIKVLIVLLLLLLLLLLSS